MSAQRRGTSPTHYVCSSSTCQLSEEEQEDAASRKDSKASSSYKT